MGITSKKNVWRGVFVLALAAASTSVVTGCSSVSNLVTGQITLDVPLIEDGIKAWLIEGGTETASVECPDSMVGVTGDSWLCLATDPWDFTANVRVTITSSNGFVEWELVN